MVLLKLIARPRSDSIAFVSSQSQGIFAWVNGEDLNYKNWDDNNPSTNVGDDCVRISDGQKWDNVACKDKHNFICQTGGGKLYFCVIYFYIMMWRSCVENTPGSVNMKKVYASLDHFLGQTDTGNWIEMYNTDPVMLIQFQGQSVARLDVPTDADSNSVTRGYTSEITITITKS